MKKYVLGALLCLTMVLLASCTLLGLESEYTVKFETNGGTPVEQLKIQKGTAIDEPQSTKAGYVIEGWYSDIDFLTAKLTFPFTPKSDVTLYAKWSPTRTVHWDTHGGNEIADWIVPSNTYIDTSVTPPPVPVREGYVFVGWYFGYNNIYEYPFNFETGGIGTGITLHAKWDLPELSFKYHYSAGGDYISVSDGTVPAANVVIPAEYDGLPVTKIVNNAFKNNTTMQNITIPSGVTEIGYNAFDNCSSLAAITIPDSVTAIGTYAFYNCTSLKEFEYPASLTDLGYFVLSGCSGIESITLPFAEMDKMISSIISIGFDRLESLKRVEVLSGEILTFDIFRDCAALETIVFPEGLRRMGSFTGCANLKYINIPDSVESVDYSLAYCPLLEYEIVDRNLCYIGKWLVKTINTGTLTTPALKAGTVGIANMAFKGASALTTILLPDSIKYIGDMAFEECRELQTVILNDGLERIGSWAFYDCPKLREIFIPDSVTVIKNYNFGYCNTINCAAAEKPEGWGEEWTDAAGINWGQSRNSQQF